MMNASQLIDQLARDLTPVPRHAVEQRIVAGLVGGAAITVLLVILWLGIRPDLGTALYSASFWMKWGYTLSLALLAIGATMQLARPEAAGLRWLWPIVVPVLLLLGIGVAELLRTPSSLWLSMWLGGSWSSCPWKVLALAAPIFLGLLWSFRRLAPTRLRLAGFAAGVASGAVAAMAYCLHCPETSAVFVLTWYSLGILLAAAIGAVVGPRLLRW